MTIRGNVQFDKKKKLEDENKLEQEIKKLENEINNDFSNIDENSFLTLLRKKKP